MRRRHLLAALGSVPILGAMSGSAMASPVRPVVEGPPTVNPEDLEFRPRVLRSGTAADAGLDPVRVDRIAPDTAAFMEPGPDRPEPCHPGFVVLAARDGVVVTHDAGGYAVRYASYDADTDTAVELPRSQWVPMTDDTVFDLASVSKLFTSMVATQLAAEGRLDLDATVTTYLPEFAGTDPDKASITLMHLLRHVSGLKSWINLTAHPDNAARMAAIYDSPLQREPGSGYEYSDLNLITMGVIIETVTGSTLDVEVAERITGPLGMTDTCYNPPESMLDRIAATEYQDGVMVRGRVHDENAHAFGGVAGHAGVFSTAADLAVFAQTILNGGEYDGHRLLSQEWVRALLTNHSPDLPPEAARGLGWQIDQRFYMDALSSPVSVGHTGFTGTCLTVDPLSGSILILLTNRVHPTRNRGTASDYRRPAARDLAYAIPVRPEHGRDAWYTGTADNTVATLTADLPHAVDDGRVHFKLWSDTEPTDVTELVVTSDAVTWQPVTVDLTGAGHHWTTDAVSGFAGRRWIDAWADLPAGTTGVAWRHTTDANQHGRGVYVDRVKVVAGHRVVFDGDGADRGRFTADGWQLRRG